MDVSPNDISSLINSGANGMNGMWNNPFMYLIWLSLFNNGSGFGGFGGNNAAAQGTLTRAELAQGFQNQDLMNEVRATLSGLGDINNAIQSGNAGISQQLCQSFSNLINNMNSDTNMLNNSITQTNFTTQMGINSVNNNLSNLKYEISQNCCDLKNAMHAEGEATRNLMVTQEIQNLRDGKESALRDLQSAQVTLANNKQTSDILNSMGRYVPYSYSIPPVTPCISPCSGW
jgi:predicted O-linked N-acetylglucosamine transferase (SPINDLY family)